MNLESIFRLLFFIILVISISISKYYRKKASQTGGKLSGTGRNSPGFTAFRIVAAILTTGFMIFYLANSTWIEWSYLNLPEFLRWSGAAIGFICTVLFFQLFRSIGKNISETEYTREGHKLVTSGPYNYIRHPLYSVSVVWYQALFLLTASWVFMILGVVIVIFLTKRIPREETNLIKEFGDEYLEYMKNTGMLFPKFKG